MRKNKQKNSENISAIVNNLLIFRKHCDKINKSKRIWRISYVKQFKQRCEFPE